jgi:hypothetical protein
MRGRLNPEGCKRQNPRCGVPGSIEVQLIFGMEIGEWLMDDWRAGNTE